MNDNKLKLVDPSGKLGHPIYVDFLHGELNYRQRHMQHQKQLIGKAVGIKEQEKPVVIDATAGLGQDSFILNQLGCQVTSLERSPVIAALLEDGMHRFNLLASTPRLKQLDEKKQTAWQLIKHDSIQYLSSLSSQHYPDVIYLDPMYPNHRKSNQSALNKKEMRFLRAIVGDDLDAEDLLSIALQCAKKRVVVKRPRLAPYLNGKKSHHVIMGKSTRFDVYTLHY
jgi:16S rRNA (guanine1516-N2)-methyltransferase